MSEWRWPHFKPSELACKCCGELPDTIDASLLDRLELLRVVLKKPLRITSGHRCRIHNLDEGGAVYSQHKNLAVDISLRGHDLRLLYQTALSLGILGIGLAQTFIHLDMRNNIDGKKIPKRLTVWYYSEKGKEKWQSILSAS